MTANGGQAGLRAFDAAKQKPDLLLCDIQMPISTVSIYENHGRAQDFGGVILMSGQGIASCIPLHWWHSYQDKISLKHRKTSQQERNRRKDRSNVAKPIG